MKRKLFFFVIALFVCFGLYAQTNGVPTTGSLPSLASLPTWLQGLVVPATLVIASLLKKYVPRIPANALPFIVPFIGAGVDILLDLVGLWGNQGLANSAIAGAALGGLATWLHQMGKQSGVIPSNKS